VSDVACRLWTVTEKGRTLVGHWHLPFSKRLVGQIEGLVGKIPSTFCGKKINRVFF